MSKKQHVLDTVYKLANDNGVTVSRFLKKIETMYFVDKSKLPTNADGNVVYPNGDVGVELDLSDDLVRSINEQALEEDVTANEIVLRAINAKIDTLKQENPDAFKDL